MRVIGAFELVLDQNPSIFTRIYFFTQDVCSERPYRPFLSFNFKI